MNIFLSLVILILFFTSINTGASETDDGPPISALEDELIVHTANGDVRGSVWQSVKDRPFYSFIGMPYAKPPIGTRRFKAPVASDDWPDVFKATNYCSPCPQISRTGNVIINEDCLCINVFTPTLNKGTKKRLSVMVYIHGGGFVRSSAIGYAPHRFMDRDICLVTLNYRLGALGHLSTADDASRGNYATLDQRLALQWVQKNIEAFGCDPDRVTLFGESAGSVYVLLQLLLPHTEGLFHAAIVQSSTAIAAFSLEKDPLKWAVKLAQYCNCSTANSTVLVDCLRSKSATDLIAGSAAIGEGFDFNTPFPPVIDGVYITKEPSLSFLNGEFLKVPTILGTNKHEGVFPYLIGLTYGYFSNVNPEYFTKELPHIISCITKETRNLDKMAEYVKREYYDRIDINNSTAFIGTSIDFCSDSTTNAPMLKNVIWMAAHNRYTYMYSFEYAGTPSIYNLTGQRLVSHGDELYYLFNIPTTYNDRDQLMSDQMTETWTQFAQTLTTPQWWTATVPGATYNYLVINSDGFNIATGFLTRRMLLWNILIPLTGGSNPLL